jgi:hypothetical protein
VNGSYGNQEPRCICGNREGHTGWLICHRDNLQAAIARRLGQPSQHTPSKAKETPPEQVKSGATKQRPGAAGTARGTAPER